MINNNIVTANSKHKNNKKCKINARIMNHSIIVQNLIQKKKKIDPTPNKLNPTLAYANGT